MLSLVNHTLLMCDIGQEKTRDMLTSCYAYQSPKKLFKIVTYHSAHDIYHNS